MDKIFDFGNRAGSERAIRDTWTELRNSLAQEKFIYSETDKALETTFLRVFDDLFSHCHYLFDTSINELVRQGNVFVRGAVIRDGKIPTYDRFLPKAEYIKDDNRFSPPGVEWLYLALGKSQISEHDLSFAEECAIAECRAQKGDYFALCEFKAIPEAMDAKLVDLTIAGNMSFDQINNDFEVKAESFAKKVAAQLLNNGTPPQNPKAEIEKLMHIWASMTYSKLMSEQIFIPVSSDNKKIMYAPFQCIAQYFISKGYDGIIYSSTVYNKANNLVLFDRSMATPTGRVKDITI